jgi:hypothetical protein
VRSYRLGYATFQHRCRLKVVAGHFIVQLASVLTQEMGHLLLSWRFDLSGNEDLVCESDPSAPFDYESAR